MTRLYLIDKYHKFQFIITYPQSHIHTKTRNIGVSTKYIQDLSKKYQSPHFQLFRYVIKFNTINSVVVGNGLNPVTLWVSLLFIQTRHHSFKSVLVAPEIVRSLISIQLFTTYNWCSIEFDPFGFFLWRIFIHKNSIL